jgi:hypothetical protein
LIEKLRHLVLNDVPDDLLIDGKVVMDHHIAESGNLAPFYRRMQLSVLLGDLLDRLSDDREIAQDRVKRLLIRNELFECLPCCVAHYFLAGAADVIQKRSKVPGHSGHPFRLPSAGTV